VLALLLVEHAQRHGSIRARVVALPVPLRWSAYAATVLVIMTFGVFGSGQFIYFQF
jgi:hypothetical protein